MRRVVITGMGALTPIGNSLPEYWDALLKGTSGAAPIKGFDASKFKTRFACELKNFDVHNYIDKGEARKYDPFTQYALVACDEAIKDAGLDGEKINKDRVGVIWASGNGGFQTFHQQVVEFALGDGTPRFNPYFIPKVLVDIASGIISMRYGYRGVNFTTISACASATTAIIEAFNYIKWGKAEVVVTGGSEAAINESGIGGFNALKALSTNNENYGEASRPFDVNRDGFVMGEGAGALILEEYEHAKARGAQIYAEVGGGGMSGDAYHLTATHPEGAGAQLAIKEALREAEMQPSQIDHINMHATSTPLGDISEIKGLGHVFGEHLKNVSLNATKSQTGHLLGAAGAIEAIATAMAVKHNLVPPTINTSTFDPVLPTDLNICLGQPQHRTVNTAMSSTFGFGGHNAIVLLKKFQA